VIDLFPVVIVVDEGCMNVGEGDARNPRHDFVRRESFFVPKDDILHANAMANDKRALSADARAELDMGGLLNLAHE
jgi:hypothetical protein